MLYYSYGLVIAERTSFENPSLVYFLAPSAVPSLVILPKNWAALKAHEHQIPVLLIDYDYASYVQISGQYPETDLYDEVLNGFSIGWTRLPSAQEFAASYGMKLKNSNLCMAFANPDKLTSIEEGAELILALKQIFPLIVVGGRSGTRFDRIDYGNMLSLEQSNATFMLTRPDIGSLVLAARVSETALPAVNHPLFQVIMRTDDDLWNCDVRKMVKEISLNISNTESIFFSDLDAVVNKFLNAGNFLVLVDINDGYVYREMILNGSLKQLLTQ